VYLTCNIEKMLYYLKDEDISIFREPDIDNAITSIAVVGNPYNERLFKKLKLLK
jgi:hypothetical protein